MSIKNYKSFNKNQNIEVGPITIFVGPNSAGKSSILKLLGLFHQNYHSLNFRKVQYNGEIVDLKDFESITTNNNKKDVEINFKTARIAIYSGFLVILPKFIPQPLIIDSAPRSWI